MKTYLNVKVFFFKQILEKVLLDLKKRALKKKKD